MSIAESAKLAADATGRILSSLATAPRGVVVDSPPGAGKSTLVVRAARELADTGEKVMVLGQTNEQVDDLIARLAASRPDLLAGRLCASSYAVSDRVLNAGTRLATAPADLAGCAVVFGTAAKWATITDPAGGPWPWAIVDEAYQMRSDLLLRAAGLFRRALFVGDPGQLDPFSVVETERWTGLSWDPMSSAVAVMLAHNSDVVPVHTLPVSWRLPASAAPVVSEAFYPFTGFTSATEAGDRALEWKSAPRSGPADEALRTAAGSGWALRELPRRHTLRTDAEAVAACADLAARALELGAVSVSESGADPLTPDRIAIGTAHRDQALAVRSALAGRGVPGVVADTANRLQGREFDLTIVLHPLSGRRDATTFHLEAGRLCVLASRHRQACVVVARAGIPSLLDAHPSAEPVHLGVPVKFPDGWEAHQAVMAHLSPYRVPLA
ncbi:MAG: helicase [Streptosporangiales bacterium]|nr:helicase [Streptosporangiales bacterium]